MTVLNAFKMYLKLGVPPTPNSVPGESWHQERHSKNYSTRHTCPDRSVR